MKALRLLVGVMVGGALAFASTHAAHGGGQDWAIFSPFTLPGMLVAAPFAFRTHAYAYASEMRNANLLVVDGVDFIVYSVLFCWLLSWLGAMRE